MVIEFIHLQLLEYSLYWVQVLLICLLSAAAGGAAEYTMAAEVGEVE